MNTRNLMPFALILTCIAHPVPALARNSKTRPSTEILRHAKSADFNRSIYYKNKLEFSVETGWLPFNIPFPFDAFLGDVYDETPLQYTLVPTLASLRLQMSDVTGPPILRGNWDLTFTGEFTAIPRGPETHYLAYDTGIRYNFVPRNWKTTPYFEVRGGVGRIDAKGPLGVPYAQGQDLTFNFLTGSGFRYNFNSKYSIEAGVTWMHISNFYLSEPKFLNYGINVYGPIFGFNIRLGKPKGRPH